MYYDKELKRLKNQITRQQLVIWDIVSQFDQKTKEAITAVNDSMSVTTQLRIDLHNALENNKLSDTGVGTYITKFRKGQDDFKKSIQHVEECVAAFRKSDHPQAAMIDQMVSSAATFTDYRYTVKKDDSDRRDLEKEVRDHNKKQRDRGRMDKQIRLEKRIVGCVAVYRIPRADLLANGMVESERNTFDIFGGDWWDVDHLKSGYGWEPQDVGGGVVGDRNSDNDDDDNDD